MSNFHYLNKILLSVKKEEFIGNFSPLIYCTYVFPADSAKLRKLPEKKMLS